ncbi:hypothetical protein [Microbacterium allomyrinae]|uniref:Uncharacterized protein n=1 Tax=Microbacterium allomyrinae TaxID=2830666 RepID=A0A9X1LXU0_9MICO|nr:hypothetical protein [Microbacterium allomyrinae]MCC2034119.1 hypothetical protein [Microbacterium allomyrinae]
MTVPANTAKRTKRWKLKIGADEYQGHTSAIAINPNPVTWQGGDDNTLTDDGDVQVQLTVAQDTANADSLYRLCHDNPGQAAVLEVFPHYDDEFSVTVNTVLVRPPLNLARAAQIPEVQITLTGSYVTAPEIP